MRDVRVMSGRKNIVVAVDFSRPSLEALDHAIALAAELKAAVFAVHALDVPLYAYPDVAIWRVADVDKPFREAADKAMADALEPRRGRGVPIETIIRKGPAWEVINAVAEELGAAYVVVGTRGRRGLPRALLGSVAERVVRTSKLPVIVLYDETRVTATA